MKKTTLAIYTTFSLSVLLGSFSLTNTKYKILQEDPSSEKQISFFYSTEKMSKEKLKQIRKYDALVVSDLYLVDYYQRKGVDLPIFFIPFDFHLDDFLKHPLKVHPNPIFTFGHITSSNEAETYIDLIKAFHQAFGDQDNVALHIYCSCEKHTRILKRVLADSPPFHVVISTKSSESEFLQSLDCYINLSPEEHIVRSVCRALALGIPVVAWDKDGSLPWNNSLPTMSLSFHEKEELAGTLQEIFHHQDSYLENAKSAREWAKGYEKLLQTSVQNLRANLSHPKKLIFGYSNAVHERYLQTNSAKLYQKYNPQISSSNLSESKPLIDLLQPLDPPAMPSGVEGIDCVYVINLDERPERWEAVKKDSICKKSFLIGPKRSMAGKFLKKWPLSYSTRTRTL